MTPKFRWHWFLESGSGSVMRGRGILLQSRRMDSIIGPSEKVHAFLGSVRLSEIAGRLQRTFVRHKKFWKQVPTELRGRQKWASADRFGTVEVHGARCVKFFDNGQFVGKRQKMKARASKVSCLSRKVVGKTWLLFWLSVKNAQFHMAKHLTRWVPISTKICYLLWPFVAQSLIQTELKTGHFGAIYSMCRQIGWVVSWGVSNATFLNSVCKEASQSPITW